MEIGFPAGHSPGGIFVAVPVLKMTQFGRPNSLQPHQFRLIQINDKAAKGSLLSAPDRI